AAGGTEPAIPLRYTRYLTTPILRTTLLDHPILSGLAVIRAPQGTNFKLTESEWQALQELLSMNWDAFIYWAKKIYEWPGFAASERDYKVALGSRLAAARKTCLEGGPSWIEELRKAIQSKDNNLSVWQVNGRFV